MKRVQLFATRHSLVLAPILLAMLLAAINYDNNLVYLVLFWLVGLVIVSSVYTYRNLARVRVRPGTAWPVFAGKDFRFTVFVENRTHSPISALGLVARLDEAETAEAYVDHVAAGDAETIELIGHAPRRGIYFLQDIEVRSGFPLGVIGARATFPLTMAYVVYPDPSGNRPWPEEVIDARDQDSGNLSGGDDFYGVRPYQRGEPQRHIDWKAVARGMPLMVKQFVSGGTGRVWFRWQDLEGLDVEVRLSQLAQWVLEADEKGQRFGLELPGSFYQPGKGRDHYHTCMKALAAYGEASS